MMARKARPSAVLRFLTGAIVTLLAAGFLGSMMIRFGPGYEADERWLDSRYSDSTLTTMTRESSRDANVFAFYGRYMFRAMQGDFGKSRSYDIPVGELIRARGPVTLRLMAEGLALGWFMGLGLAGLAVYYRWRFLVLCAETMSAGALSLPAAVLALLLFLARGPVFLALALVVFPRVFRYARDLFEQARAGTSIEAARARGVKERNIFLKYVVRPGWPPLLALGGASFSLAFGAIIPVEVVCDIPGIGQLAWKAAMARDLPVLVTLTLLVTAVTIAVNGLAEWARAQPETSPEYSR